MIDFCNIPDSIFRDLKMVLIYNAEDIPYTSVLQDKFPSRTTYQYAFNVVPNTAKRSLQTKFEAENPYFEVDINFSVFELNPQHRADFYNNFNQGKRYAVVLVSNTEMMMVGNSREPLALDISDALLDNNTGNDAFSFNITGKTILYPRATNIIETFRVLLLLPPVV